MLGFTPTASMASRGEKLGWDMRIGQPTGWGLCQEPFFLGAVALLSSVDNYAKGCHVRLVTSVYMSCVSGFSYRMYIDLNQCDSQI
jgi:hypothetical protein